MPRPNVQRIKIRPKIRPAIIARTTRELADTLTGGPALVVGNGPSRIGRGNLLEQFAVAHPGRMFACNAFWRTRLVSERNLAALVVGEGDQGLLALEHTQVDPIVCTARSRPPAKSPRLMEANPWHPRVHLSRIAHWHPHEWLCSTYSGELALELAWLSGANPVYLIGVDAAVRTQDGTATISACAGEPGYEGQTARTPSPWPNGDYTLTVWRRSRAWLRAVTDRMQALGVEVYRAAPGGCLDWLEVRSPV